MGLSGREVGEGEWVTFAEHFVRTKVNGIMCSKIEGRFAFFLVARYPGFIKLNDDIIRWVSINSSGISGI